jgi:hypothetical protein
LKTCFISAPPGLDLSVLHGILASRDFNVLVPSDLTPGSDWASQVKSSISQADLVIAVLTSDRQSPWVMFELGQASALGRRIMLINPPESEAVPFNLQGILVLQATPDNNEAIEFALDQLLAATDSESSTTTPAQQPPAGGLGSKADDLVAALDRAIASRDWFAFERVVEAALYKSGIDAMIASAGDEAGADFAVWSDVLESFVGNPLIVEVKGVIRGSTHAHQTLEQLSSYLSASGSRWALLVYARGPDPHSAVWSPVPPNILLLPARALFEALRSQSFPELVRDLRNRRVHGIIS